MDVKYRPKKNDYDLSEARRKIHALCVFACVRWIDPELIPVNSQEEAWVSFLCGMCIDKRTELTRNPNTLCVGIFYKSWWVRGVFFFPRKIFPAKIMKLKWNLARGHISSQMTFLTLFRGGGGGGMWLFLKIIWQQFDMTCDCPGDLAFPWQPYFDRHFFQNFNFSSLKIK